MTRLHAVHRLVRAVQRRERLAEATRLLTGVALPLEAALWDEPRGAALHEVIAVLFASYREVFPTDDDWLRTQRDQDDAPRWLPPMAWMGRALLAIDGHDRLRRWTCPRDGAVPTE